MAGKTGIVVSKCADYSPDAVRVAIDRVLDGIGGLGTVVTPGKSVLLKPNLLTDRDPANGVTTHPEVARALVLAVRKCGGIPFVADSPANVTKIDRVWEKTGFREMCERENVPLVNLEKAGSGRVTVGDISFTVAQPVLDADVIINVPKVKTHMLTIFTGAVKNLYGTIPGFQKTTLHKLYPTPADFGNLIAALYGRLKPQLSVADAVIGMDGEGPSSGDPVKLGFIAASRDGVALDMALCRILGIDLRTVPYFRPIISAGLGETSWERIEMKGARVEDLAPARFRLPSSLPGRLIPRPLVKVLQPYLWIRPRFLEVCVSCGRCVKACPMEALRIVEKGGRPTLDPAKCIGCCCCHEVCPQRAVEMRLSPFLSFFRRGKLP